MNIQASNGVMQVGHQLDNLATVIDFPIQPIYDDFGSTGTFTVRIQRNGDSAAYPTSNFVVADGKLSLTLTASDMNVVGEGKIQIKYTVGTTVVMSRVYKFYSHYSLSNTETVPDPWQSWVDQVEEDADRAEEAVEHYPYIDSTTHHWMVWDAEEEEFVDTGVNAQGTSDFEDLENRPKYNGSVMTGDTNIPVVPGKTSDLTNDGDGTNPFLTQHQSLSSYRTSAAQDIIDATKVDKETGKGLSTNDYDNTEKANVASNTSARHTHSNKSVLDAISEAPAPQSTTYTKTETDTLLASKQDESSVSLDTTNKTIVGAINELLADFDTWHCKHITKTTLEAVAVVNSCYYLGEQSTVAVVLPASATAGDMITVVFYSGSTATTLSITGSYLGTLPTPSTNQRIELNLLYDGTNWTLLSNVMATS